MKQKALYSLALLLALLAVFMLGTYYYVLPQLSSAGEKNAGNIQLLSFVIYYADGTQQVIDTPNKLQVYTATLTSGGKAITGIGVTTKVTLDTGGRTVSSWNSTDNRRMEIYKAGETVPLTSSTATYPAKGYAWNNGEQKIIATSTINSDAIEGAIKQYAGTGTFVVQVVDQVSIIVDTEAGSYVLSGTGVATLTIDFVSYSSMSVVVSTAITPLSASMIP